MPGNRRHIPPEQKELIIKLSAKLDIKTIAHSTEISERTIRRLLSLWRTTGKVTQDRYVDGRPRLLGMYDILYLESLISRTPDLYLSELRDALLRTRGVEVSEQSISNALRRRGYTRKKATRDAGERSEAQRTAYQQYVGENFRAEQLVFLDESHCNRHTSRRTMAWARAGCRARRQDVFIRGTRYSVLPAISLDGVLHLDVLTSSWNGAAILRFVNTLLQNMNPFPQKNSVIIMDNASPHHVRGLRDLVESRGMKLVYLPPYSPDFDPIEEGFSSMKSWMRANRDYVFGELTGHITASPYRMIWDAVCMAMTPSNIAGWFRDSGYLV